MFLVGGSLRGEPAGCGAGKTTLSSRSHSRYHGHADRRTDPSDDHRSHDLRHSKDRRGRSKGRELRSKGLVQRNRSQRERLLHNHNRPLQEQLRMGKEREQELRSKERELHSKVQELRSKGLAGSSSHRHHGCANGRKDQRWPNRQLQQQTW